MPVLSLLNACSARRPFSVHNDRSSMMLLLFKAARAAAEECAAGFIRTFTMWSCHAPSGSLVWVRAQLVAVDDGVQPVMHDSTV